MLAKEVDGIDEVWLISSGEARLVSNEGGGTIIGSPPNSGFNSWWRVVGISITLSPNAFSLPIIVLLYRLG